MPLIYMHSLFTLRQFFEIPNMHALLLDVILLKEASTTRHHLTDGCRNSNIYVIISSFPRHKLLGWNNLNKSVHH